MKATLLLAAAFAFATSAALAQTANPATQSQTGASSGTVATDPTANPPAPRMDNKSSSDKRAMRKAKKTKSSDGSMKMKTKM